MSLRWLWLLGALALWGCRVERVGPSAERAPQAGDAASGEVWIYTSMYRPVLDGFDALFAQRLPGLKVRWFQAGSEKVANRLEAELAAGGTQADLLVTSDPFLYERLKQEGRFAPYASVRALRIPRALLDPDGAYAALRLSTMVIVHAPSLADPPRSFRELTGANWRGRVAIGDPLTSGTAFTWAVAMESKYGEGYFAQLRAAGATVAGGNAAVLQKVQGGEVEVGVLLLENALTARARGARLGIVYPADGAVIIPGYLALFRSSRNPAAARAAYELLLSAEGQALIVGGDMHAVDPALPGPGGEGGLTALLERAQPWTPELLAHGLADGARVKSAFSRAFAQ